MSALLSRDEYVQQLCVEGERLLAAAQGKLDLATPTCPGWSVADVVEHVGMVYGHKIATLELGRRPAPGEWQGPSRHDDDVEWCHGLLHRLVNDLVHVEPSAPAWTWWEADQTAGFWHRRMAHETAVHRADVEAASGAVTPIDSRLALDGIDEMLDVFLGDIGVTDVDGPHVVGTGVAVTISGTRVAGQASDLLLWLWGRESDDAVTVEGDAAALRALLRDAGQ